MTQMYSPKYKRSRSSSTSRHITTLSQFLIIISTLMIFVVITILST